MKIISILCMVLASPVAAEKISLNEISSYFNAITTAEAPFSQITDTGETSTGRLFIRRPGRIRFEYDPPEATLVVVGGGQVAVFDPKSRDEPLRFPLRHSPLNLVLEREVDLAQRDMVVAHFEAELQTAVTLLLGELIGKHLIQPMKIENIVCGIELLTVAEGPCQPIGASIFFAQLNLQHIFHQARITHGIADIDNASGDL